MAQRQLLFHPQSARSSIWPVVSPLTSFKLVAKSFSWAWTIQTARMFDGEFDLSVHKVHHRCCHNMMNSHIVQTWKPSSNHDHIHAVRVLYHLAVVHHWGRWSYNLGFELHNCVPQAEGTQGMKGGTVCWMNDAWAGTSGVFVAQ